MSFGQVVEDADLMAFINQHLGANTADVAGGADDENFHRLKGRRVSPFINPTHDLQIGRTPFSAARQSFALRFDVSRAVRAPSGFVLPIPTARYRYRHGAHPSVSCRDGSVCIDRSYLFPQVR